MKPKIASQVFVKSLTCSNDLVQIHEAWVYVPNGIFFKSSPISLYVAIVRLNQTSQNKKLNI